MKFKIGICIISLVTLMVFSCESDFPELVEYDDNKILHEHWPFYVGVAVPGSKTNNTNINSNPDANALNTSSPQHRFLKHFNVVAAENEMKPENMLPGNSGSSYSWTVADELVNYAKANNKKVRGHVLIWHAQTPNWFFEGSGTAGRATIEQLYTRMEAHIKAVFERYKGDIEWWDVVNEAVDHDYDGPRRDSMYTQIMQDSGLTGINRYEYILKAFQWARHYADENGGSNVKLYLTDFGIERPFQSQYHTKSKQANFLELVEYLIDNNAPIDGVGFQGHFRLYDHPVEQISAGIDLFSKVKGKDLTIQICELDISIFSNAKGEAGLTRVSNSVLNERLKDLGDTYRAYFDMFEKKYDEGKLDLVLIWGIADGHSWLNNHPIRGRTDYPLLFSRNNKAKEAYWRLVN